MSVKAITPDYRGEYRDDVKNFHGKQLLMVSWEKHTMMGWPMALAVDPAMSFGDLIDGVLPSIYGMHPEFHNIQWDKVQWSTVKGALIPDRSKSLAEHGLRHKSQVRFRTPGAESNNYGG